jgi:hypothetical protein
MSGQMHALVTRHRVSTGQEARYRYRDSNGDPSAVQPVAVRREDYEEKWVVARDTTGGAEFIMGFEGSQALPVCPSGKCKHLTGTSKVKLSPLTGRGGL